MDLKEKNFLEILEEKIDAKDYEGIKALLEPLHPADIAEILSDLDEEDSLKVFRLISGLRNAGDVLSHLSILEEGLEREILEHLTEEKISAIISNIESDEAADMLNLLPAERKLEVLSLVPSESRGNLKKLLQYENDTAGGLMDFEYLVMNEEKTIREAITFVREEIFPHAARLYSYTNIYAIDDKGRLAGVLPLKNLLFMPADKKIKDVMDKNAITVQPNVDQEEVARIFIKYDLTVLPVVDRENRVMGRITVDDVIDVIQEEATEDIYRMVGTDDAELWEKSVLKVVGIRLPWLLVTLMGGLLSGLILKSFRVTISEVMALVFFVPVIAGMGGNIGIQSSTIVVRGLATGYIDLNKVGWVMLREIRVGLLMGLACGCIVGIVANFMGNSSVIGIIVGISMFFAISVAAMMGCLTPILLKRLNIDPAISSGPFVTTANDITGVAIYLGLSTALIQYIK